MVKNSKGGYHKANARKDSLISSQKTRLVSHPSERYAKVTKLFGGNRCSVISSDGDSLSCVIRGKFSGKFKHSNLLSIDSFILVGIHDWASDKSFCDLLHVYQPHDIISLYPFYPSFFNPHLSIIHSSSHDFIPIHIDNILNQIDDIQNHIDNIDIIDDIDLDII